MYNLSDNIVREIVDLAVRHNIEKVVLFGSRAKGTNSKISDIDLAVYGGNAAMFSLDVEEEVRTLLIMGVLAGIIYRELRTGTLKENP